MNTTIILQFFSYFVAFIPLIVTIIYWYKKKFAFDSRANLIGVFILFYFFIQFTMLILALNSIHNLYVLRIFVIIEIFIFSFFLFSFQIKSRKIGLILSILLSIIIIVIDLVWGNQNSGPVESIMVEAIVITLLGMAAIPSIRIKKDYESSFFYFTFAIIFASVNNLLGVGFIELAPDLSFNIQAVVNITSNVIFAWGFIIIIKSKPETEIRNTKENLPT